MKVERPGDALQKEACDMVPYGWTEALAAKLHDALLALLQSGKDRVGALEKAYTIARSAFDGVAAECSKAGKVAWNFANDHPIWTAVIVLGILVVLFPWAIEALGFAELGPVEGSFAAWWQSTYAGYVPAGSLFSFFQRLGMVGARWIPAAIVTAPAVLVKTAKL